MTGDPRTQQALDLAEDMSLHWQGHDPAVQGAALAQCLAIWLAAHPRKAREALLDDHIVSVRRMIPIVVEAANRRTP